MPQHWRSFAKGIAFIAALALTVVLTQRITIWLTAGPEQYCKTAATEESWAPDRTYKATVLKKDCNMGESISYSVRLDALSTPERREWFTVRQLETDAPYPSSPTLSWITPQQLEITMATGTLDGRLTEQVDDHLVVTRIFKAAKAPPRSQ
jgi:hypothetical protein